MFVKLGDGVGEILATTSVIPPLNSIARELQYANGNEMRTFCTTPDGVMGIL